MHIRAKLTWITLTTLALGVAQTAEAESPAPARAGNTNVPNLALLQSHGVAVGPELQAALASLGGPTKKSDKDALADLNRLGDRQAATGVTVASSLTMPSASGSPIQSKSASGDESLQLVHSDTTAATSTDAGSASRVAPVGDVRFTSSTSAPSTNPESVIRGQINPAAKSCYANDPDSKSRRPGKLVILVKVTSTGAVDSVSVPVNIGVSPSVISCVTSAARTASFAPPGATGATIPVAFTFPGPADQAAPASHAPAANAPGVAAHDNPTESAPQSAATETAHR